MSATGLTTSTPSRPADARTSAGASAPPTRRRASGTARRTRGQMSSSSRRAAKRFGRYMRRPVKATTGARSAGPARQQRDAVRHGARAGGEMRRVERRRREEDRGAPGGPRLGGREAGRLDGPVRPAPRRGVVPCRLTRGLGERVDVVHDARERRAAARDARGGAGGGRRRGGPPRGRPLSVRGRKILRKERTAAARRKRPPARGPPEAASDRGVRDERTLASDIRRISSPRATPPTSAVS